MAVRILPPIAGGALAGIVADRLPRRLLVVAAEGAGAVVALGALAGVLRGSEAIVFACVGAGTLASSVGSVSMNALVPALVPAEAKGAANAALLIVQETAVAAGALGGGLVVALGSVQLALALDAASFVAAGVLFAWIRADGAVPRSRRRAGLRAGVGYVRRHPTLRAIVLGFALMTAGTGLTNASLPRLLGGLGLGAGGYGYALAALAAGGIAGEAVAGSFLRVGTRGFAAALGAMSVLFAVLSTAGGAGEALAAIAALGAANGAAEVVALTVVQRDAEPEFHGRAFAALTTLMKTTMLGAVTAAPLVARLGAAWHAPAGSSLACAVAAAVVVLSARQAPRVAPQPA